MNRLSFAAAGTAVLLALAGCSSSSSNSSGDHNSSPAGGTSQPPSRSGPTIIIKDFGYTGSLTVKSGARVTVINNDGTTHTLTDKKTGKFDTKSIDGDGGTGSFVAPDKPGKYPFGCTFHPEMAGTLTVTG